MSLRGAGLAYQSSGHVRCKSECPLWAKSGLMQCSKTTRIGAYSITSSEAQ